MFTRNNVDRFATRVLSSLVVTVARAPDVERSCDVTEAGNTLTDMLNSARSPAPRQGSCVGLG